MLDTSEDLPVFELLPVPTLHLSKRKITVVLLHYRQSFNALKSTIQATEAFQVFSKFLKPLCFLQNLCLSIMPLCFTITSFYYNGL